MTINFSKIVLNYSGYIPAVFLFSFAILMTIFFTVPNIKKIIEIRSTLPSLIDEVSSLTRQRDAILGFDDELLTDLNSKAEIALPTEKSFAGLLSGLESLSLQANSQLVSFDSSPGLISSASGKNLIAKQVDTLPFNVDYLEAHVGVNSNNANLIDLTGKLVKSGRLVTLEQISFNGEEKNGQSVNTQIILRVYFQPKPKKTEDITQMSPINEEEKELISKVDAFNRFAIETDPNLPIKPNPFSNPALVQTATSSPSIRF